MKLIFETTDRARISEVNTFIQEWNNSSDSITVNTSGSTGNPKSIKLSKKYMVASAKMTGKFLELKGGNVALLCLSTETIAGKMMIVRSIILDLDLIVVDVDSSPLLNTNANIDFAAMVPLQARNSLVGARMAQVKKLIVGGGVVSSDLWNSIASTPTEAYQTFGMTETISHVAMRAIKNGNETFTAYTALPGVEFGIKNDCLTISAPNIGVKELKTNDFVNLIDAKQFEWLGRKDFVINSGGVKIHPEQIELTLNSLIDQQFFSSGLTDKDLGEKHVLCIESSYSLNLVKEDFKKLVNKHNVPKEIYYFNSFRYTESGKINRIETLKDILNAKKQIL